MNPFSALADPNEPVDPKDVEFFKFSSLTADAKVAVQDGSFGIDKYPATVSLIACSSKYGYFVSATVNGFLFGSTKALRKTFLEADKGSIVPFTQDKISVPVSKPISQLRLSATEDQVVLTVEGGELLVYNVNDIKSQKEATKPVKAFSLSKEISDLRPNPEEYPNLAAVLFSDNHCSIIDITTGSTTCELPVNDVTAICWSPKGKQIVCGKKDGSLEHYDINGDKKDGLSIPPAMSAGNGEEKVNRRVQDVLWVENHIFLVLYARQPENEDEPYINDGYIINRKPSTGTEHLYIRLAEITPIFTTEGRGNHFYMETIRGLGKEIKHLIVIANAATNEISAVGEDEQGEWVTWQLPENGIAGLPLSSESSMDTYPLGLCLDFSADEKLPPFDASDSDKGVEPVPIFYYINDEGHIGAYYCYNIELARRGESYKTTEPASSTSNTTTAPSSTQPAFQSTNQTTNQPFGQSTQAPPSAFGAFGAAASSGSSFGDLLSGKASSSTPATQPSGFGSFSSFKTSGNIPSFSNLGSAAKISTPSFGFSSMSKPEAPKFGSTTNFGSGSSFSKPATTNTTPAITTTTTPSITTTATSSITTPAPLVATAPTPLAATATTPSFTTSTTPPVTTNTSSSSKTTTTAPVTTSAFTSTKNPTSAFSSLKTNPAASVTAAATTSTTATTTATSKTATTTPSTTSFGQTGFGQTSFGQTSFGQTGFGQTSFGQTSFGQTSFGQTSFGQTGFGQTSFGQTSFGQATPKATPAPVVSSSTSKPTSATSSTSIATTATTSTPVFTTATPPPTSKTAPPLTTPKTAPPAAPAPSNSTANTAPLKKEAVSTAKEGMAKEFEAIYFTVTKDLDNLNKHFNKVSLMMKANTIGPDTKSKECLNNKELAWVLNDAPQLASIADDLISEAKEDEKKVQETYENVNVSMQNCKKLMDKQGDIEYLLGLREEKNSNVVDILDNRELDVETKDSFIALQNKVDSTENIIEDIELKVEANNNRNKMRNEHNAGTLSLYSLHRSIRDIERDIVSKNKGINELEAKYADLKLEDSKRKSKTSSGFSYEDLSDSEDEPDATSETIAQTARYIRRYRFLDTVINETSKRAPLQASPSK